MRMGAEVNRLSMAHELGQSIWLDQISREIITGGTLERLAREGVGGVTTNPSIFEKAVSEGTAYDKQITDLVARGFEAPAVLDRLMIDDVRSACDVLRPLYDETHGRDGFVSIEVKPELANEGDATVAEARRLWQAVSRPNVMVKIPGTVAGLPAIRACLAEGININITLMFSMAHYEAVVEAFFAALEDRLAADLNGHGIASVASFFVSRLDTLADKVIDERLEAGASDADREALAALKGKLAVANCKLVYERFNELFSSARWVHLADNGAAVQRVLWASTSTKNPAYPELLYVEPLIGAHTINTLPAATLEAFRDHGEVESTVERDVEEARAVLASAGRCGIDLDALTEKLQVDGVAAFQKSFDGLLDHVAEKCRKLGAA
jgi:transaldolase